MISSNNAIGIVAEGFRSCDTGQNRQPQLQCAVTSICAVVSRYPTQSWSGCCNQSRPTRSDTTAAPKASASDTRETGAEAACCKAASAARSLCQTTWQSRPITPNAAPGAGETLGCIGFGSSIAYTMGLASPALKHVRYGEVFSGSGTAAARPLKGTRGAVTGGTDADKTP